jgi:hypothetical protein
MTRSHHADTLYCMLGVRLPLAILALCAALVPAVAGAAKVTPDPALLWATINACNPADAPGSVGIRGSMPGDGDATQRMFMRVQVQFQGPKGAWHGFPGGVGDSGFLPMGSAKQKKKQGGQTFELVPQTQTVNLRGLVTYQWRAADGTVVRHTRQLTTAGHPAKAGSDPPGYSAATCVF